MSKHADQPEGKKPMRRRTFLLLVLASAVASALLTALVLNIMERKQEGRTRFVRLVEVTEDTTDPAVWGKNWPRQYDSYLRTAESTRTRFGGHGGQRGAT